MKSVFCVASFLDFATNFMREILEMTNCMHSKRKIPMVLMFRCLKEKTFGDIHTQDQKGGYGSLSFFPKTTCYISKVNETHNSLKEMKEKTSKQVIYLHICSLNQYTLLTAHKLLLLGRHCSRGLEFQDE